MCEEEEEIAERDPCPTLLYKKYVEDVALLGKVRRGGVRIMRLRCCIVGSSPSYRIEEREQGS